MSELKSESRYYRNIVKWVLLTILSLFLIGVISIIILFKTIFPNPGITNFSLGDNFKFLIQEDFNGSELSGEIEVKEIEIFFIEVNSGSFEISQSSKKIKYTCQTTNPIPNFISKKDNKLSMRFDGKSRCIFKVPEKISVIIEQYAGMIDITELKSDLSVKLSNGQVNFSSLSPEEYNAKAQIERGQINNLSNYQNQSGRFKVNILVQNGQINFN